MEYEGEKCTVMKYYTHGKCQKIIYRQDNIPHDDIKIMFFENGKLYRYALYIGSLFVSRSAPYKCYFDYYEQNPSTGEFDIIKIDGVTNDRASASIPKT